MGGGVAHGIDCISIHAPREGCDAMGGGVAWLSLYFNPRTPRGVRRAGAGCSGGGQPIFQSTHPARGATWRSLDAMEPIVISIHAPREGCDWWWKMVCSYRCHFNPRTPRGVRPRGNGNASKRTTNFNPRTPRGVRRRTTFPTSRSPAISIHAPREGCDVFEFHSQQQARISIHAPREGCDSRPRGPSHPCRCISIHAPREGCDALFVVVPSLLW